MPLEMAKKYILLFKSLGIEKLGIIGGEPTIHNEITKTIEFAKEHGMSVTIYSNGRKLSDNNFTKKIKEAGTDYVNFSLQGIDAGYHDKLCGVEGAWNETIAGINNCIREGIKINISSVVSDKNSGTYTDLMDHFKHTGANFVFFREIPAADENIRKNTVLPNKESAKIFTEIYLHGKNNEISTYLYLRMPLCWFKGTDMEKEAEKTVFSHCHITSGGNIIVDVDGGVLPCLHWVNMPVMSLVKNGQVIEKEKFLRGWNSGKPKKLMEKISGFPDQKCMDCEHWAVSCEGGCPLLKTDLPK